MKLFFVIAFNLVFILVFFLFAQQKNKDLVRELNSIENNIKSKQNLQLAIQNFKFQQQQILLRNKTVGKLEPQKYQTLNFAVNLVNGLPEGISLIELTKLDGGFVASGKADTTEALNTFVNLGHLKLLKSTRLRFEVSGNL